MRVERWKQRLWEIESQDEQKEVETVRAEGCYDTKILSLAGRGERDRRKAGCRPPLRDETSEREMERTCSFSECGCGVWERRVWGNE